MPQAISNYQRRLQRARDRLTELEAVIAAGGDPPMIGLALREEVYQTLERLPVRERRAWIKAHGAALFTLVQDSPVRSNRER